MPETDDFENGNREVRGEVTTKMTIIITAAFAWPGGYPVFYLEVQDSVICQECAPDTDKEQIETGE